MRRYFYSDKLNKDMTLSLQGDLFHHIFEVCRLQVGQHFELLNNSGVAYLVCVESVNKKSAQVVVQEERAIPTLKEPFLHLFLSFPKVSTFESILEKSVEMGVKSITPVLSDFSSVRSLAQFPSQKTQRWEKIILQATQQSGRGDLLQLKGVRTLEDCLAKKEAHGIQEQAGLTLISYEGEACVTLKAYLQESKVNEMKKNKNIGSIFIFVGSEGGFSHQEVQKFKTLDLVPVTLGDQVLRVETACMTLVSCLKYEFNL